MLLLIKGGTVLNPPTGLLEVSDILIQGGKITEIAPQIQVGQAEIIEASGLLVVPGLVDPHVHLREPGFEGKETIRTGCASAAAGGYTSIACMPNTEPVTDNRLTVNYVKNTAVQEGVVKVYPIGAVTKGSLGKEMAEIGLMVEEGIVAVSDDGQPVDSASMMLSAMQYAAMFDLPIISHCEERSLAQGGAMHYGLQSTLLGIQGIPDVAEAIMVARDILLAEFTGARLHIAHVSCAKSVELIRSAKARGVKVTAEVTPHHLVLIDEDVKDFDTHMKMNPPLRSRDDRKALREALRDGTIDMIATDHAPHSILDKDVEFERAPFGVVGLETALSLVLTELVEPGHLTLEQAVSAFSCNPASFLGIEGGNLKTGVEADLTLIDLKAEKIISQDKFYSKGKNTPFEGRRVRGFPVMTLVRGKVVMKEGRVLL
ncbi:dihydroorotase [Candidatus Contubernalis alkaliaceticus]|uniref:dihydroorotase n=1 Tax=Candidatus Contubernalis alkaliaceticus TaxID=338645 RepID=UPI001F4C2ABA|nr:dihydroorotase [Candidatus Contubernalis alkalaceticus]UNC93361.1 dihydroorotase [Candidatus Contubernalis alkalaceticus]